MPCAEIKGASPWGGWGDGEGSTGADAVGEAVAVGLIRGDSAEMELGELLQPVKKIVVDKRAEPILGRKRIKL